MDKNPAISLFAGTADEQPCSICGAGTATRSLVRQEFQYGTGEDAVSLEAVVGVWSCTECELEYTDGDAEDARHAAICRHLGRLAPGEIKAIRCSAGLKQSEFAEELNVGIASVKRWELGNVIQSAAHDRLIRNFKAAERDARKQQPVFQTDLPPEAVAAAPKFQLRRSFDDLLAA